MEQQTRERCSKPWLHLSHFVPTEVIERVFCLLFLIIEPHNDLGLSNTIKPNPSAIDKEIFLQDQVAHNLILDTSNAGFLVFLQFFSFQPVPPGIGEANPWCSRQQDTRWPTSHTQACPTHSHSHSGGAEEGPWGEAGALTSGSPAWYCQGYCPLHDLYIFRLSHP